MNSIYNCLFISLYIIHVYSTSNPFDDTILYNIKWPGKDVVLPNFNENLDEKNYVVGVTDKAEEYLCLLPDSKETEKDLDSSYTGPNPLELITPLFTQPLCSYRLESYWTYEICHGRFVKQYHEERDSKKIKKQEYYLGKWDLTMKNELSRQLSAVENPKNFIKTKKIEGVDVPYFQLNYTEGTLCDLNDKPRQTNVLYMCFDHGRHDIYSIKEISTCLYEAIYFTPFLCKHPLYKPKNAGEKDINCMPLKNASKKPASLLAMETESSRLRHEQFLDRAQALKRVLAVFSVDKSDGQEGEARLTYQIHPLESLTDLNVPVLEPPAKPLKYRDVSTKIKNFLSGDNCLRRSQKKWEFEFCYGKRVTQFYKESKTTEVTVELGKFSLEEHKNWLLNNPSKKPKKQDNVISHFYSKGSYCEAINAPRETEVRFSCIKKDPHTATFFYLALSEPQTCRYILHVDSHLLCMLMPTADEYGLFDETKLLETDVHDEL